MSRCVGLTYGTRHVNHCLLDRVFTIIIDIPVDIIVAGFFKEEYGCSLARPCHRVGWSGKKKIARQLWGYPFLTSALIECPIVHG